MKTVNEVFNYLNELAPVELKEEWDNVGILIGSKNNFVSKITLALDATDDVIDDAIYNESNLIITHHPLIFKSINKIEKEDVLGRKIYNLISNNISLISMHTNLDKALLNKVLIKKIGCDDITQVSNYMCIGCINEINMNEFVSLCINNLENSSLRYFNANRPVHKIACIGGAGANGIYDAFNLGCDTFITADVKHHEFLLAKDLNLNLIDADHFNTENVIIKELYKLLSSQFMDLEVNISIENKQVVSYG